MASLRTIYDCAACHARTDVTVLELPDPATHVDDRARATLRMTQAARNQLADKLDRPIETGDPGDSLAAEIQANLAADVVRYATCPVCGARDADAIAAVARAARGWRLGIVGFFTLVAVGAVFVPKLALIPVALSLLTATLSLVFNRRARSWRGALGFAIAGAMAAIVLGWPRVAFGVPALLAVQMLFGPSTRDDPFARAAERLQFDATPYRG